MTVQFIAGQLLQRKNLSYKDDKCLINMHALLSALEALRYHHNSTHRTSRAFVTLVRRLLQDSIQVIQTLKNVVEITK